jgi:hypothetical protein
MPELSNIQTFEKIDGVDFKPTLNRFIKVLKNIDLWNYELEKSFDRFEWNVINGFAYSDIPAILSKFEIKIRPNVMGWTPEIDDTFKDNWVSCDLLIEADKLRGSETGEFFDETYKLVKTLAWEMQKEFQQTGVYFTDEAQDAQDFGV